MHNNTEIKRDIKNLFLYSFKAISVLLYHKVSALWLVPAGRKGKECKIPIYTSYYIIARKVYIGMASTSICVTYNGYMLHQSEFQGHRPNPVHPHKVMTSQTQNTTFGKL